MFTAHRSMFTGSMFTGSTVALTGCGVFEAQEVQVLFVAELAGAAVETVKQLAHLGAGIAMGKVYVRVCAAVETVKQLAHLGAGIAMGKDGGR